jgi:nucleotide-binding universal stress UspA family protein
MQSRFQRVIVPTDFSDTAQSAVNLGAEVAGWYASQLDLVNVVDSTVYAYAGYPFGNLTKELTAGAEQALQRVKLPAAASRATVSRYVLAGSPAREVTDHAKRHGGDLIVIGTHGHGAVARFFLGSVADKVLHEANCPVMVTKLPKGNVKHPRSRSKPFRRILFPTDFSEPATRAMRRAVALTQDFDAELFVLHVVDDSLVTTRVEAERNVILKDLRRHALDEMRGQLPEELMRHFDTIGAVTRGDPGKQVAAYAETHDCDLIVIGSHGRTGLRRVLIGSVADKVVRRAKCNVLVETYRESKED